MQEYYQRTIGKCSKLQDACSESKLNSLRWSAISCLILFCSVAQAQVASESLIRARAEKILHGLSRSADSINIKLLSDEIGLGVERDPDPSWLAEADNIELSFNSRGELWLYKRLDFCERKNRNISADSKIVNSNEDVIARAMAWAKKAGLPFHDLVEKSSEKHQPSKVVPANSATNGTWVVTLGSLPNGYPIDADFGFTAIIDLETGEPIEVMVSERPISVDPALVKLSPSEACRKAIDFVKMSAGNGNVEANKVLDRFELSAMAKSARLMYTLGYGTLRDPEAISGANEPRRLCYCLMAEGVEAYVDAETGIVRGIGLSNIGVNRALSDKSVQVHVVPASNSGIARATDKESSNVLKFAALFVFVAAVVISWLGLKSFFARRNGLPRR